MSCFDGEFVFDNQSLVLITVQAKAPKGTKRSKILFQMTVPMLGTACVRT